MMDAPNAAPVEAEAAVGADVDPAQTGSAAGKKRVRVVHKNHEAMGACDSCRIRRIKCTRIDPDDATCEACRSRNINCTNFRNGGARYKPRSGRKINAVLAAFGASGGGIANPNKPWVKAQQGKARASSSSAAEQEPSHDHPHPSFASSQPHPYPQSHPRHPEVYHPHPPSSGGDGHSPHDGVLSDDSAEGRLGLTVETESVLASLMDLYLSSSTFSYPLVAWKNLQARFDRAGRRLSQLDLMTETLVLACVGFGALISDHPLVIGPKAPRMQQLRSLGTPYSLAPWAMRREAFCRRLVDKVVTQVDHRGVFRIACPESISILGMTAELISHSNGRQSFVLVRPYWFAQYAHSRHLADKNDPGNELSTLTHWHLAMEDSFRSMTNGTSPIMSDNDVEDFCEMPGMPDLSLDVLPAAVNSTSLRVFGLVIASFWLSLINLNRTFSRKISIPFARNKPIDVSTFAEMLEKGSALWKLATEAQRESRMLVVSAPMEVTAEQRRQFGSSLSDHIDAFPLSVAMFFLGFYHKWSQWKQRREAFCEIGVAREAEGNEAAQMEAVSTLMKERLVDGVLLVARMIEERRDGRATELFSHLNPFATVRFHLFKWAMFALKIKCAEAGGPPQFPLVTQLDVLQTFIDAMRTQAWVWAPMQDSADQIDAGLRKLRMGLPKRVAAAAGMVAPHPASATFSNSGSSGGEESPPSIPISHFQPRSSSIKSPPSSFNVGFDTFMPSRPKESISPPTVENGLLPPSRSDAPFPLTPLSPQAIASGRPSSRRGSPVTAVHADTFGVAGVPRHHSLPSNAAPQMRNGYAGPPAPDLHRHRPSVPAPLAMENHYVADPAAPAHLLTSPFLYPPLSLGQPPDVWNPAAHPQLAAQAGANWGAGPVPTSVQEAFVGAQAPHPPPPMDAMHGMPLEDMRGAPGGWGTAAAGPPGMMHPGVAEWNELLANFGSYGGNPVG